jgi:hypothetical protein
MTIMSAAIPVVELMGDAFLTRGKFLPFSKSQWGALVLLQA